MKKPARSILLLLISTCCFSQQKVQVSIGGPMYDRLPTVRAESSETENVRFSRSYTTITGSVLFIHPLKTGFEVRYGLGLRGSPLHARFEFEQEVSGSTLPDVLLYDYQIMDINFPVDVSYRPKKWFYLFSGMMPTFRLNLTNNEDRYPTALDLQKKAELLASHLAPFGLNLRGGLGFRYRMVGLELSYNKLLTNVFMSEFKFKDTAVPIRMTYSSFFFKFVFHLQHGPKKFLDWDMDWGK